MVEETRRHEADRQIEGAVVGGSTVEALGGAAALVLSIIGLSGVGTQFMASIACIVLGATLVFEGGLVSTEFTKILEKSGNGGLSTMELGGGLSSQSLAGMAVIVLGILSLLAMDPIVLLPISCIILGAGLVLSSGVTSRLNAIKIDISSERETAKRVALEAVSTATGAQVLVGVSAVVLGILAVIGLVPMILTLVAFISIGASTLLSGAAITGRMMSIFS